METLLKEKLTSCGVKKSKIESDLGMPQNSLSGMLSGAKETPKKWFNALTEYVLKLEDKEDDIIPEKEPIPDNVKEKEVYSTQKEEKPIETPKNTKRILQGEPNQNFDILLREFNKLVNSEESRDSLFIKFAEIKQTALSSKLAPRQVGAICDRIDNFIKREYDTQKHNLKLA